MRSRTCRQGSSRRRADLWSLALAGPSLRSTRRTSGAGHSSARRSGRPRCGSRVAATRSTRACRTTDDAFGDARLYGGFRRGRCAEPGLRRGGCTASKRVVPSLVHRPRAGGLRHRSRGGRRVDGPPDHAHLCSAPSSERPQPMIDRRLDIELPSCPVRACYRWRWRAVMGEAQGPAASGGNQSRLGLGREEGGRGVTGDGVPARLGEVVEDVLCLCVSGSGAWPPR